uniref:Putative ovule protein n=1 Tax=Solanum chacoense TaxID=4108 RepID=A0A0V0HCL0_SOLCH
MNDAIIYRGKVAPAINSLVIYLLFVFMIISLGLNIYICIFFFLCAFSLKHRLNLHLNPQRTLRVFLHFSSLITLT